MTFRAHKLPVIAALVFIGVSFATPVAAVSVTNRDDKEHRITIVEEDGAKKVDHVLKPNQVLENICLKGCIIRLNDSEEDEYELVEGTEVVSIEDGYLYYDQPEETPAAPDPGGPSAIPAPPPAQSPSGKKS